MYLIYQNSKNIFWRKRERLFNAKVVDRNHCLKILSIITIDIDIRDSFLFLLLFGMSINYNLGRLRELDLRNPTCINV